MKAKKNKEGLLPCPFCGRYPKVEIYGSEAIEYSVECNKKGCSVLPWTGVRKRKVTVIKIWNKRA